MPTDEPRSAAIDALIQAADARKAEQRALEKKLSQSEFERAMLMEDAKLRRQLELEAAREITRENNRAFVYRCVERIAWAAFSVVALAAGRELPPFS